MNQLLRNFNNINSKKISNLFSVEISLYIVASLGEYNSKHSVRTARRRIHIGGSNRTKQ